MESMNITRAKHRKDCKKFAKCGKYTQCFCEKRRDAPECAVCLRIKVNRIIEVDGVKKKYCTACGQLLPLHRYRTIHLKGRDSLNSKCRMCEAAYTYRKNHPLTEEGKDRT